MRFLVAIFSLLISAQAWANFPQVEIKTSQGLILIELYPDKAPITVENFLKYVKSDFYKGTIFHRTVNHFVIQGGGYTPDLTPKDTLPPISSEATNGLKNEAGMVAMARAYDPNSATSQFFINVERNRFLHHHKPEPDYYGYTVFGKVIQGMDIVQKIAALPTTTAGPFFLDVPVQNVLIEKVSVIAETIAEHADLQNPPKGKKSSRIKKRHKP
jgi:cyclophilin family peptidyl-prolyl cis-trans isomerase